MSAARARALTLAVATLSFGGSSRGAQDSAVTGRVTVARVGSTPITVGELESRIEAMSAIERAALGEKPEIVRRRVLTDVMVPEALLVSGAEARDLARRPDVALFVDRARSAATVRAIRARIGPASDVPPDEVRRFYDDHIDRYVAPERIALWRILCATREEAADVLGAAKADLTPKNFAALAREHSRDKASYLKAGDLGLLAPDGSSAEPGLRVDPSIVRAAEGVRDGELVPLPVAEGDSFSVVWRRGTVAGVHKSLEQAAGQIRDGLLTQRLKDETDKLLIALRAAKVRSLDPSPLESIEREDETQRDASPVRP